MRPVEYFGEHLYREMAMDEAPARKSEPEGAGGPSFGALNEALDEAQAAIDAARKEIRSGYDSKAGAFSYDRVRRRIADARDCMDQLEEHLGGSASGGEDEEPGERERDEASARARDGEVDHRRDFDPARARTSADARGMAHDRRRDVPDIDLDEIFRRPQSDGADAASLHEIFTPTGR
jgi:hypothetical protein